MDMLSSKLLVFAVVLTRVSAFFLVTPVFSWTSIPVRIKVAMTVVLSVFFAMVLPHPVAVRPVDPLAVVVLLSYESVYGLGLGLIAVLVFTAVRFFGQIVEQQMGLTMSEVLDPLMGEGAQALGLMIEMIFILLFLAANGHHLFLLVVSRSYETFPAGSVPTVSVLLEGIIAGGSVLLTAGLRLAAPILTAFMVLMVTLAVLARVAPEMNILFISMPMRIGLGLLMVGAFLPFVEGYVGEFAEWMGKLLPL